MWKLSMKLKSIFNSIKPTEASDGINEYLRLEYPNEYKAMTKRQSESMDSHPNYTRFVQ